MGQNVPAKSYWGLMMVGQTLKRGSSDPRLFHVGQSFDCAVRAGYLSNYFPDSLPMILGTDVSGVMEQVGEGATTFQNGDEVYARAGVLRDGAYTGSTQAARFVCSPAPGNPKSISNDRRQTQLWEDRFAGFHVNNASKWTLLLWDDSSR